MLFARLQRVSINCCRRKQVFCPLTWHLHSKHGSLIGTKTRSVQGCIQQLSQPSKSFATSFEAPLKLRQYQEDCINAVINAISRNCRRVGISLATGSGKTVIFTELIDRIDCLDQDAHRTLVLVHRRELVEQAARHCQARYPDRSVEIEMGNLHASGYADITIASVQSMNSRDRIDKFRPNDFKLILVDEAHHAVAPVYLQILEHFGISNTASKSSPVLVGVSATWARFDGLALGKVFEEIVFHKDAVDLIGENWLSPCIFTSVKSTADISRVKSSSTGDFAIDALGKAVNTEEVNQITVRAWMQRARQRKSTLVFGVDIAHVLSLVKTFRQNGIRAEYVTASTKISERSRLIDDFRNGEFPVLVNCGIFTEGTDIPGIDCILLARPTKSRSLLSQMMGRGMRLHPGKDNCHIIDMVASFKEGIVTAPTLFGLDPDTIIEEAKPEDLRKIKEQKDAEVLQDPERCQDGEEGSVSHFNFRYKDYDSVSDLLLQTAENRYIRRLSSYNWIQVGEKRFILTSGAGKSYIAINEIETEEGSLHEIKFFRRIPSYNTATNKRTSPWARGSIIGTASTFEHAVHGADKFATENFVQHLINLRGRQAQWRNGPATEAQVDQLNRRLGHKEDELWDTNDVTKGQAADMLTKLTFGAKGQFARKVSAQKHEESIVKRKQMREEREIVRVGTLPGAV